MGCIGAINCEENVHPCVGFTPKIPLWFCPNMAWNTPQGPVYTLIVNNWAWFTINKTSLVSEWGRDDKRDRRSKRGKRPKRDCDVRAVSHSCNVFCLQIVPRNSTQPSTHYEKQIRRGTEVCFMPKMMQQIFYDLLLRDFLNSLPIFDHICPAWSDLNFHPTNPIKVEKGNFQSDPNVRSMAANSIFGFYNSTGWILMCETYEKRAKRKKI